MKKQNVFPSRTTLNLAMRDKKPLNLAVLIPAIVVLILAAGLFGKVAVADRLMAADRAERAAQEAEQRLAQTREELTDYDAVRREYNRYFSDGLASSAVSYEDVLELMERYVFSKAQVSDFRCSGNTIYVQLTGSSLKQAATIADGLYEEPDLVSWVQVNRANVDGVEDESYGTILMTITLREVEK